MKNAILKSIAAPKTGPNSDLNLTPAKNVAKPAKANTTPAKNAAATPITATLVNPFVYLDLPAGTHELISTSGINWIRTPKHGDYQRWFNMTSPFETTGIKGATKNPDGTFTLEIERARLKTRRDGQTNVGIIREQKPA